MKENRKRLLKRVVSFALALVMMASAFAVSVPDEVQAAGKEFKMKNNKATVKIYDKEANAGLTQDGEIVATGKVIWIKYKAPKDGYLKISAAESTKANFSLGEWQLCNKSKKALSPITVYRTDKTDVYYKTDYFGVKKDATYYLGVLACTGVKIKAQFTSCTDKSGTKKAKSLNLKQKTEVKGVVKAGTTNSHWYKFTTTKNQPLKITIKPWMTGDLTVKVTGPGVYPSTSLVKSTNWGESFVISTKNNSVRAGTYYVEVKPSSKSSTGMYKIKWN